MQHHTPTSAELSLAFDALLAAAHRCLLLAAHRDVVRMCRDAVTIARVAGDVPRELRAELLGARALCQLGLVDEADAAVARIHIRLSPGLPPVLGDRAKAIALYVAIDRGDFEQATTLAASGTPVDPVESFRMLGYRGNLARALGDFRTARACYEAAERGLAKHSDDEGHFRLVFSMDLAIVDLLEGRPDIALQTLAMIRQTLDVVEEPSMSFASLVDHYAGLAARMLGRAPQGASSLCLPHVAPRNDCLAGIRDALILGANRRSAATSLESLRTFEQACASWDHGRLSIHIVRRALGAGPVRPGPTIMLMSNEGVEVLRGNEKVFVSLATRPILARIVGAMVDAKGQAVPIPALIAAAWPGERMLPDAARNRLHVALSTLRSLGLGDVIVRRGAGYAVAEGTRASRV